MERILLAALLILPLTVFSQVVEKGSVFRAKEKTYCQPVDFEIKQRFKIDSLLKENIEKDSGLALYQTLSEINDSVINKQANTIIYLYTRHSDYVKRQDSIFVDLQTACVNREYQYLAEMQKRDREIKILKKLNIASFGAALVLLLIII